MSRILVIDDSWFNQESARKTLKDHQVTIARSYDEAYEYLNPVWSGGGWAFPYRFDVVLCDLLMPASSREMGDKGLALAGQEMPVGFALVLMAARSGAKYVGLLTDTGHHDHPASAWIDSFESWCTGDDHPPRFTINDAVVGFYHMYHAMICMESITCTCGGTINSCPRCYGTGLPQVKDWSKILQHLTTTPVS